MWVFIIPEKFGQLRYIFKGHEEHTWNLRVSVHNNWSQVRIVLRVVYSGSPGHLVSFVPVRIDPTIIMKKIDIYADLTLLKWLLLIRNCN